MAKIQRECYLFPMNYYTVNKFESLTQLVAGDHEVINSPLYKRREKRRKNSKLQVFKYTLSGRGVFVKDGREYILNEEEGFLWEIGDERVSYYYPPDGIKPWEFFWIHFTSGCTGDLMSEIISKLGPHFTIPRTDRRLIGMVEFLDKTLKANDDRLEATRGSNLINALLESIIDNGRRIEQSPGFEKISSKAARFIRENLEENIKVQDIADHLGITREYLTRVFSSQLGVTPSRYINKEKLQRVRHLLLWTQNPIKEIAYDTGFLSVERLRARFKEEFGFTPSQYRETRKNQPRSG